MASAPVPELRMAQWVVLCPECRTIFPHSKIPPRSQTVPFDPLWPRKPEFPGWRCEPDLPDVPEDFRFQRFELMYKPA
jgi:hypothetical protein